MLFLFLFISLFILGVCVKTEGVSETQVAERTEKWHEPVEEVSHVEDTGENITNLT